MGLNSITVQLGFISMRKSHLFAFQIRSFRLVRNQIYILLALCTMLVIGGLQIRIHFNCAETTTEYNERGFPWRDFCDRIELRKFPLALQALKHPLCAIQRGSRRRKHEHRPCHFNHGNLTLSGSFLLYSSMLLNIT